MGRGDLSWIRDGTVQVHLGRVAMTADGSDRSFGAPRFDVVLRGYDRRQVDEHLSRLNRVLARMRSDLDAARQSAPPPPTGPPAPGGARPRPTPRPRPDGLPVTEGQDVVGTFTDRMQTIRQAAEDEAAEIRGKARAAARAEEERLTTTRASVRAEEETTRAALVNLVRQRDAVLADLTRMRGQLEALLSGPTARITVPTQDRPNQDRPNPDRPNPDRPTQGWPAPDNASVAAARRDAGAGQPLPGTAQEDVVPAGSVTSGPAGGGAAVLRPGGASESTTVTPPPGVRQRADGADAAEVEAAEPAAEQTTVMAPPTEDAGGSPAERTAIMSPADATADDAEAAGQDVPPPGDATVKVAAVGRGAAAGNDPSAEARSDDDREPSDAEPASASRSG
jgi:DivIVA domain-containing protein